MSKPILPMDDFFHPFAEHLGVGMPAEMRKFMEEMKAERQREDRMIALKEQIKKGRADGLEEALLEFKDHARFMSDCLALSIEAQSSRCFDVLLQHAPKDLSESHVWIQAAYLADDRYIKALLETLSLPKELHLTRAFANTSHQVTLTEQRRAVERLIPYANEFSGIRAALFIKSETWFDFHLEKSAKEGRKLDELLCYTADNGEIAHVQAFLKYAPSNLSLVKGLSSAILRKKKDLVTLLTSALKVEAVESLDEAKTYWFSKVLKDAATYGFLDTLKVMFPQTTLVMQVDACCSAAQFKQNECFDFLWNQLKNTPKAFTQKTRNPLASAVYGDNKSVVRKILKVLHTPPYVDQALRDGGEHLTSIPLLKTLLEKATLPLEEAGTLRNAAFDNKVNVVRTLIPVSEPKSYIYAIYQAMDHGALESLQLLWEAADKTLWTDKELKTLVSPKRLKNVREVAQSWSRIIDHTAVSNYMLAQIEKEQLERTVARATSSSQPPKSRI